MDRRQVLLGAAAVAGATSLPTLAGAKTSSSKGVFIETFNLGPNKARAVWSIDAWTHPHRRYVEAWIKKTVAEAALYCHGDGLIMDRVVRLEDTQFEITVGKKVFSYKTGATDEESLQVTITEYVDDKPAVFAPVGLASTFGLTNTKPEFKDTYHVRKPLLRYDEERELRYALGDTPGYSPNSRISYDHRWMRDLGWDKAGVATLDKAGVAQTLTAAGAAQV